MSGMWGIVASLAALAGVLLTAWTLRTNSKRNIIQDRAALEAKQKEAIDEAVKKALADQAAIFEVRIGELKADLRNMTDDRNYERSQKDNALDIIRRYQLGGGL